jgi:transposase
MSAGMAAYSQDLRDRVIDAVFVEGMSRRAAAARFGVSDSAAIKWVGRVERGGSRTAAKIGGYKRMMLEPHREFIEAQRSQKPDITLRELCDRLLAARGVETYTSVTSRFLRHLGLTLKKRRSSPASRTGQT